MSRRYGYFVSGEFGKKGGKGFEEGLRGEESGIVFFTSAENLLPFRWCRRLDGEVIVAGLKRGDLVLSRRPTSTVTEYFLD